MTLPSTWSTIDPAVWDADQPLHSAVLQRGAINGRYIHKTHTRGASVAYDADNRPLMCGAIPPTGAPDTFERVCIPYLWEPDADVATISVTVSLEMFIPSGTGSLVVNCFWVPLAWLMSRKVGESRLPLPLDRRSTPVTLSATGDSFETFSLDMTRYTGGPIVIWLTAKSSETSTAAVHATSNSTNFIRTRTVEVDDTSGAITSDLAPARLQYLFEGASEGSIFPRRRQVIRQEANSADISSDDIVYIWPPYDGAVDNIALTQAVALGKTPRPVFTELTSIKIYGVSILDVIPVPPEYGTMMDAGQGPGSKVAQYLYDQAAVPSLSRTQVHTLGSLPDVGIVDDFDAATPVSNVYDSTEVNVSGTTYDVQTAYLQHRDEFLPPSASSDLTRTGITVLALVALEIGPYAGNPRAKTFDEQFLAFGNDPDLLSFDVDFRITMSAETGGTTTSGDRVTYRMTPVGYDSGLDAPREEINLFAALLDLQRGISNGTTGNRGTARNTHAHTLYGAMPESSWADSILTLVRVTVKDATASQRLLTLQARISGTPFRDAANRVHLLSWLVMDTPNILESGVEGV